MSRRDYEAAAAAIREIDDPARRAIAARRAADTFARNKRFDRVRFYGACNVGVLVAPDSAGNVAGLVNLAAVIADNQEGEL